MPPVYQYKCMNCEVTVDVVRDVDARNDLPTPAEIGAIPEPDGGFDWVRQILPPKVAFGAGWSGDGRGLKGRH